MVAFAFVVPTVYSSALTLVTLVIVLACYGTSFCLLFSKLSFGVSDRHGCRKEGAGDTAKCFFSYFQEEKQNFASFGPSQQKIFEKYSSGSPLGKNLSDTHGVRVRFKLYLLHLLRFCQAYCILVVCYLHITGGSQTRFQI